MRASRWLVGPVVIVAAGFVLSACGSSGGTGGEAPSPDAAGFEEIDASCTDYFTWREAQDALDGDLALELALDEDADGVACNELAQAEYEEAWPTGYTAACEDVFFASPDGVLYLDDTGYEQFECEDTDPGPGEWEGDSYSDPEEDGLTNARITACDEFFNGYVGGDLFWGDDVVVTQADCENGL